MTVTNRTTPRPVQHNSGRDPESPDVTTAPAASIADSDTEPYALKSGDTLSKLAERCDTSVEELLQLNPALKSNPNALKVGEMVNLPVADAPAQKPRVDTATQQSSRARAMSGETQMRARLGADQYAAAPPITDVAGGGAQIRRGMKGESVNEMQRRLNAAGADPPLALDGKFGPKTEAALRQYQAGKGIQQTGVLGSTTWGHLGTETAPPAGSRPSGGTRPSGSTTGVPIAGVTPGPLAARLGDAAEREARRLHSIGKCALGVNNALSSVGVSGRGNAYEKAEQLARNSNFREVNVPRDQLDNLPRGTVVVWGRSAAKPYGHVTVALGNGTEASDHVQRMIMGGRYGTDFGRGPDPQGRQFRVFVPTG